MSEKSKSNDQEVSQTSDLVEICATNVLNVESQEVMTFDTEIKTFNSLDDYTLTHLLSYLTVKEKLAVERVCKRWQTIVVQLLEKQTGFALTSSADEDSNCLVAKVEHSVWMGDIREAIPMANGWYYDLTSEQAFNNLRTLSQKCQYVKCFHINHAIISGQAFEHIVELFPDFECLHLKGNILKITLEEGCNCRRINEEWDAIGKVLGPVIIHLLVDPHYEFRMNEMHMKNLIQHFRCLEEFRVGSHFERDVVGKFLSFLPKNCYLFYSLGRELTLCNLLKTNAKRFTYLIFFSNSRNCTENLVSIGKNFSNLVKLKVNLTFDETILNSSSPILELKQLKQFGLDMNSFSEEHIDDGLIWCIKDGLPSVEVLEISRAFLSNRALNAISFCLPQLKKLVLKSVEFVCKCPEETNTILKDRSERYECSDCKTKCWKSISELQFLKELQFSGFYYRTEKPKPFHEELCQLLPEFKHLRYLSLFRFDISSTTLFQSLNKLMDKTDPKDMFTLVLRSVPMTESGVKTPKVLIIEEKFML